MGKTMPAVSGHLLLGSKTREMLLERGVRP